MEEPKLVINGQIFDASGLLPQATLFDVWEMVQNKETEVHSGLDMPPAVTFLDAQFLGGIALCIFYQVETKRKIAVVYMGTNHVPGSPQERAAKMQLNQALYIMRDIGRRLRH